MDEKIREICTKLHEIEDSTVRKRNESLRPIQGKPWKKTKLRKDDIIELLTASDNIIISTVQEICKLRKDLLKLVQPAAEAEEKEDAEEVKTADHDQTGVEEPDNTPEETLTPVEEVKIERPIKVCQFYLQNRCRHGRQGTKLVNGKACDRSHPAKCRKYCAYGNMKKYGCDKGEDCRYYHPALCKQSKLKHECLKSDCKLQHLRNTRRAVPKNPVVKPPVPSPQSPPPVVTTQPTQDFGCSQQPRTSITGRSVLQNEADFLDRLFHRLESRLEDLVNSRLRDFPPLQGSQSMWRAR